MCYYKQLPELYSSGTFEHLSGDIVYRRGYKFEKDGIVQTSCNFYEVPLWLFEAGFIYANLL